MRRWWLIPFLLALGGCNHLIFHPEKGHYPIPEDLGIERQTHFFRTSDDRLLHGWFIPALEKAQPEQAKGTVFFLHGNAQNISTHLRAVWWLPHYGYNVFLFDYRGFGHSQGEPSLAGLHRDVPAALDYLFSELPIDPDRVVIYGQSLGASLGVTAAPRSDHFNQVRAVMLEGAFTSYRQVAREALGNWWLTWALQWPLSYTISDQFRPIDHIGAISPIPLLIIQGADDRVIAAHHSQDLFTAAREPKQRWVVEQAGHNNALAGETARQKFLDYLSGITEKPQQK
ncbi:alpha/beta hydrolase [Thiohalophilus sp.]|uniref:alpha/beta hydrolase n=1 Tax=Thiohalophilus sp. TaxID=3028392 RepID=UPI002ACE1996|nr:alpha/beta hydrolase [Thiohalophilus sp.]MDZ7661502.1 alpha/beta hydrolase [Thiohalophilus sp.]